MGGIQVQSQCMNLSHNNYGLTLAGRFRYIRRFKVTTVALLFVHSADTIKRRIGCSGYSRQPHGLGFKGVNDV